MKLDRTLCQFAFSCPDEYSVDGKQNLGPEG